MSKAQDAKKEGKKEATKTLKEKRAEKKAKKEAKKRGGTFTQIKRSSLRTPFIVLEYFNPAFYLPEQLICS
ncbi:MAG: hypothetical protein RIF39_05480 [Cyclobacteriaceae bacterium]